MSRSAANMWKDGLNLHQSGSQSKKEPGTTSLEIYLACNEQPKDYLRVEETDNGMTAKRARDDWQIIGIMKQIILMNSDKTALEKIQTWIFYGKS